MAEKAWVISVNMGYGHQRTAYALRGLAKNHRIINANDYEGITAADRNTWELTKKGYELVSGFKRVFLVGDAVFSIIDYFQRIFSFYPKRNLSKPSFQLKQAFSLIKKGWGKHLIEELKIKNKELGMDLPIVSTFFTPAFMAEFFGYPGEIFCVVCDADISRAWAPLEPGKSKIKYFASTGRVVERLKLYGVREEKIFFTGYPLPQELIGSEEAEILKGDLKYRILNLDPRKEYIDKYKILVDAKLGQLPKKTDHPLTITFCVGGAGVQKEIGIKIMKSLKKHIKENAVKIILVAGIRKKVNEYFLKNIKKMNLEDVLERNIEIIFGKDVEDYFRKFSSALRKTDILWTKPSELSFYAALGLPIIVAPTVGSQEEFNKRWLLKSGFGLAQENPNYASEWLFDWVDSGYLAEAALQGFIEGEKMGTYKISKIIQKL
jgi:hypothetical protein